MRLRRGCSYAEFEWSVGPVPVGPQIDIFRGNTAGNGQYTGSTYGADADTGDIGKEVVSRFTAQSLASQGVFYTDANGREFQERRRDQRPTWDLNVTQPISGNFYPVTAAAFLRDKGAGNDSMQVR